MSVKQSGIGLYEFLIESELQHYYNAIKNELKVQSVVQFKYVTEEDMVQIGMSRPEIRRLKKFFQKHYPQTYLAKMKKKLLSRKEDNLSNIAIANASQNALGKPVKSVAPGRHIIQAESIVIHKTLGSGEFGTVQQGVWTSDDGQRIQVAIKCLSQERMENNPVEFLKEAAIMHQVDHDHIVRLYGVVLDTSALMLVTELAPLRSLLECLKEPAMLPNLSVPTLYDFAVQICDGMQYLESKRLIHRDLAARNILVFSRNKVKISDFGLSRALGVGKDYYQTNFNVNLKLPIAWCAPECINFLRFTSSSDVWAYGVTLWEVFSYGFQPWAALTGQQILEAIDEPNFQRLEKPECCPNEIYYQIMLKCWQHDPVNRPTFVQLSNLILECKPEQVQAIKESESKHRRDFLIYDIGDIITVLDRTPLQNSEDALLWKGVLKCGKSGLFNPGNTITYLGSSLPSVKQSQSPFTRNDSRSSSLRKGRISADMISCPQGDLKHTGHVGPDGQVFGDITFLGAKCWVPRQVVPPYKPELSPAEINGTRPPPLHSRSAKYSSQDFTSSDTAPLLETAANMSSDDGSKPSTSVMKRKPMMVSIPGTSFNATQDHEYHEISDEENELLGAVGVSNPAMSTKSQSPVDSPRFEKSFDLDLGPSLIDEVFSALEHDAHEHPDEAHNVKNELREMARSKKRFVSVKPISSSDRRTLDHAIAMANELASKSMLDLDRSGKSGMTNSSLDDISSPRTPNSPSHRKKFSFMLGASKNDRERRNYSQEAASIPDIQSTLTEEAKDAYNCLVEKPAISSLGFLTPSFANKSMSFHFPEKCGSKKADFFEPESKTINSSGPQSLTEIATPETSSQPNITSFNVTNFPGKFHCRSFSKNDADEIAPMYASSDNPPLPPRTKSTETLDDDEIDGNPLRLLRQNKQAMMTNVLPLPPKKSSIHGSTTTRHQRKHPLLIPNRVPLLSSDSESNSSKTAQRTLKEPPAPPPKPSRHSSSFTTSSGASKLISSHSRSASIPEEPCSLPRENVPESESGDADSCGKLEVVSSKSRECTVKEITEKLGNLTQSANKDSEPVSSRFRSSCEPVLVYENILDPEAEPSSTTKEDSQMSLKNELSRESRENSPSKLSGPAGASTSSSGISSSPSFSSTDTRFSQASSEQSTPAVSKRLSPPKVNGYRAISADTEQLSSSSAEASASGVKATDSGLTKTVKITPGNSIKIKTLQRILGPTATEQDCEWALEATDSDSAHAVKLLRLKSLLPEQLMTEEASRIVSVLEMSHWDVARAASFLLEKTTAQKPTAKPRLRTNFSNTFSQNHTPDLTATDTEADGINNNLHRSERPNSNYIRPTQV